MVRILERARGILARPEQTQVSLGVVALVVLVFGFWYLRTAIRLPFALESGTPTTADQNQVAVTDQGSEDRTKDTDGDGLTDYDEVHLYHTSPYLKDTDSDGYDDKTEIESGNDPTCPKGQTCLRSAPFVATGGDQASAVATSPTPTADQIRQLLKQQGATDQQLAQYDDATLVQLYQEVATESPSTGSDTATPSTTQPVPASGTPISQPSTTTTPELTSAQKDAIRKMTPAQLRDFLIQGGASKALLDQVDDATLEAVIKQQFGL